MLSQSNSSSELYNLRWNSYLSNLISVFTEHQHEETLVDVTLGCEGQIIKAHKLVLSACSQYFQSHTSPELLILLNDVKFDHLRLVIQFMYKGEVKVADSEMQQFLQLGKMLQVKGLCSVELQEKQKVENTTPIEKKTNVNKKENSVETPKNIQKNEENTAKKRRLPSPAFDTNPKKKIESSSTPIEKETSQIPRPPNAFMIFTNQWRKKLAVEYPNESNKDISIRLGNMWKSLSPETKDTFYEEARKAEEEHRIKYPTVKEAKQKKNSNSGLKTTQRISSSNSTSDSELIEIKCEDDDYSEHSSVKSNG